MRIAVGGFMHESHSFAPRPTRYIDFVQPGGFPKLTVGQPIFAAVKGTSVPIAGAIEQAEAIGNIAFGDGSVWVSAPGFPITRINPATAKVVQQFAGEGAGRVYSGLGSVWLANLKTNTLTRFDPKRIAATLAD